MNKITRLSFANIKKHKLESFSLVILVLLCVTLMGSSISGIQSIKTIFPDMMERTGSYENFIAIDDKAYYSEYESMLKDCEYVEEVEKAEMLYSYNTNYLDKNGKEHALYMAFVTNKTREKTEKGSVIETTLTDEEIKAIEHPIYMPFMARDSLGFKVGEQFDVVFGTRKFSFIIAGFYEAAILDETSAGLKMIVSDSDYNTLSTVIPSYAVLLFNDNQGKCDDNFILDFAKDCEAYSNKDIISGLNAMNYRAMEMSVSSTTKILLDILIVMAVIIIIAVVVMLRFRISSDIKEQIVSIGVLEALGYTSKEITLSYVIEYLIISITGAIFGFGGCFILTPALTNLGFLLSGHPVAEKIHILPFFLTVAVIVAFVSFVSFTCARKVRNYPPVYALRKGTGDHRFGKQFFPLKNTKFSVHLRIALQGFFSNFKHNIGLTFCMAITSFAVILSFIFYSFFESDGIMNMAGMELSDIRVEVMGNVNAEELAEKLSEMPEIRKALPTSGMNTIINYDGVNNMFFPVSFKDYSLTENISALEGRFPEHDNEVMISNTCAKFENLKTGDSITLEYMNVEKKYVITGIATAMTNGGANLYITEAGMQRLIPTYKYDTIEIYLNEGVDADAFKHTLTSEYGRSIADVSKDSEVNGAYEERIKAAAEQKIAEMIALNGATDIEYSIQVGDEIISGNSNNFAIKSFMNISDIMETQLSSLVVTIKMTVTMLMIISAVVVMIILTMLMESTIRKQRKELGIMKAMGYTSKELMFQLSFRIMPATLISVIIGTVLSLSCMNLLTVLFGEIQVDMPEIIVLDIVILLFCFACAYVGARKIKKISVCELMTE